MGTRLGRYEIIRTLARGSLTDLLLGRATGEAGFQRHVAIKQLREEHAQDAPCLEMFVNEARLAAALHHHNIVQVTDIGDEGGQPFFAMEYVHGVDLRRLLTHLARRQEQLPLQHVVSIIAAAAAALHHAHEQRGADGAPLGIVHRQVTPANILIGFDGNVKIVDFGIAKAAIKRIQTGVGVLKGSAPYMAPEQCAGRTIDRRSDVFALGIVLYELATVRRLFKGANEFLTMSAVVNAEVPRPSQYRRDVPSDLEVVMLKALARDPLARYQTAADMANALDRVARSVGVGASTSGLANYMKLQFGERKEPWLEQTPQEDPEPTEIDFDGNASGLAPPPSEALTSNAIPKTVAATQSSPIARARTVVTRAKSESASQTLPLDKSFSVTTTVDEPEPASSRQSTEVGEIDDEGPDGAATKNDLPVSAPVAPPRGPGTIALKVPIATPAGPPATIALKLPETPPAPARPPATVALKLPPSSTDSLAADSADENKANAVAPPSVEPTRGLPRGVITDATAIVEPLAVVVARAQTTTQGRSRKLLYIGGGAAVLVAIILAIVLWPSSDLSTGSSAAPVAESAPDPEAKPPEPPEKSAMDMTARDYEAARSDAAVTAEVAAEADAAVEVVAEVIADAAVAEPDAAVEVVAAVEPAVADPPPEVKKPEVKKPAATAAKTPKRTPTKKTAAKRTTTKKTTVTTKKATKPKWNPDDLFLGE